MGSIFFPLFEPATSEATPLNGAVTSPSTSAGIVVVEEESTHGDHILFGLTVTRTRMVRSDVSQKASG